MCTMDVARPAYTLTDTPAVDLDTLPAGTEKTVVTQHDEQLTPAQHQTRTLSSHQASSQSEARPRTCWLASPTSRRVPVEIWSMIFTLVIGSTTSFVACNPHGVIPGSDIAQSNAYNLTLVCSHWRQIVLGLPNLWTSIEVNLRNLEKDIRPGLKLHLDHSKGRPLDLVIDYRTKGSSNHAQDYPGWSESTCRTLDYLVRFLLPRCKGLWIYMDGFEDYFLNSPDIPYPFLSFPSLVQFSHDFDISPSLSWRAGQHWFWDALRHRAPLLRSVSSLTGVLPISYVHYPQLTELHILAHLASPNLIYTLLSCTRSLEVLSITDSGIQRSQFLNMQSNSSLPVHTLTVDLFSFPTTILDVLSFFTFPHLTTLRLTAGFPFCCFESSEDWINLFERINHYSQTIQHLELQLIVSDQPHIHREGLCLEYGRDGQHCLSGLFRAVPNLTELTLSVEGEGDAYKPVFGWLFPGLTIPRTLPTSPDDILLPKLRSLSISDEVFPMGCSVIGNDIVEMMTSRSALSWWPSLVGEGKPVALLERFMLGYCGGRCESNLHQGPEHGVGSALYSERVRALRESGTECVMVRHRAAPYEQEGETEIDGAQTDESDSEYDFGD
ncbi:hypothetical protein AAF712_006612 [Marasmius tenuissimus]|uniref:F-box domain-containing protein n=1 Tax=Marasmius tenuissimus TaxID=585030 RepID=A0ABR2ZYA1_9AGAR